MDAKKEHPTAQRERRNSHYLYEGDYYTNQHEYALAAHLKNILQEVVSSKLGQFPNIFSLDFPKKIIDSLGDFFVKHSFSEAYDSDTRNVDIRWG